MMVKQINPDDFPPTKPDKDGIRYLRGKKALEYEEAWEKTNIEPWINPIFFVLLEVRRVFIECTNLEMRYFDNRHCYTPVERRLLDLMYVYRFEQTVKESPELVYSFSERFTYRYLKFKYSPEEKRFCYWWRTTSHDDKKPVYVWHEDVDTHCKMRGIKRHSD